MHPLEGLGIREPLADESAANYDLFIKGRTKNQKIRDRLLKTQLAAWRSRMQAKGYYIGPGNTAWIDDNSGNPIKKGSFKPNLPKPGTESNLKTWKDPNNTPIKGKSNFQNRISGKSGSEESTQEKEELSVAGQKNKEVLNQIPKVEKDKRAPASGEMQSRWNEAQRKAAKTLDQIGPGGPMTPEAMQALAIVAPNAKGNRQSLRVLHYFRDDPRFKDKVKAAGFHGG